MSVCVVMVCDMTDYSNKSVKVSVVEGCVVCDMTDYSNKSVKVCVV